MKTSHTSKGQNQTEDGQPTARPITRDDWELSEAEKEQRAKAKHPRSKFIREGLIWAALVAVAYFGPEPPEGTAQFSFAAVGASILWIFPAFRLFQWWQLVRRQPD